MARRIQPIFDSVLSNPRLVGRERDFVESLQAHYKARKSLTAGRRRCLLEIEAKLDAPPVEVDAAMAARLDDLKGRASAARDTWAAQFAESLLAQLQAGRKLSPRQLEILSKVEARHSDEAVAQRATWEQDYDDEKRTKARIVARYYRSQGQYFREAADKILSDESYVVSPKLWSKMIENPYAKKVTEAFFADPKFNVGSLVLLRKGFMLTNEHGLGVRVSGVQADIRGRTPGTKAFVLRTDGDIISAARGAKRYQVLFVGTTTPVWVEERFLKKAKV